MQKYRNVLFDLDGTISDPKVGITKSIQYALRKMGITPPETDELTVFIGPPLYESFQRSYGMDAAQAKQAIAYYREYFAQNGMYENRVYSGVQTLLEQLRKDGRFIAVATSKPTEFSETILQHFNIRHLFHLVVGSNMDGTRSAKAEIIRCVMDHCPDSPPESFVMIGDRAYDIIGANENGIDSIGVTYGYGTMDELLGAGPTFVAHSFTALQAMLM